MPPSRTAAPRRSANPWIALVVIIALATVLAVAALSQEPGSVPKTAGTVVPDAPQTPYDGPATGEVGADDPPPDLARRDPADPLAVGEVDATVVMVVFSDYQCPFCALWSTRTLPALEPYLDAGDLRVEWRDANVFGADSERGARAAYAAGLQDRFLDFHHALFADGDRPPAELLTEEGLVTLAKSLDLDVERFTADLASPEVAAAVQANEEEATQIGAFSTPSFLIDGTPVVGAQPNEVFITAVEAALDRAHS